MNLDRVIAVRTSKTIYRSSDKVIKVFDQNYDKTDVLNEALNQSRVEKIEINVPKIYEVTKIDGKWAIISQFIEGKTLAVLMKENPDKYDEYMNLFTDIQISIHNSTAPSLEKLKDKMKRKIFESEIEAVTKYDLYTRLEGMPKHSKICHGDFNPSNIIITSQGIPYVIDWAHVTKGNASADVARTYLLFWLRGDVAGANKYLELYCNKTNTPMSYVQKWLPIVAAAQSVKGNDKEKEFLLSWVNVVDYE
ncbi:MAG: phosphotransferase [Eubacterium sp.]